MPPSMKVHVHCMNLMKNQIIQKFQSLEILKERIDFVKPFYKKKMFNGFKMSNFRCRSHVKEINMPKNMFASNSF